MAGESTLYQEQWDSRVIQAYQQKGYLTKGMSIGPTKVVGKTLHFAILGKGVAQDYTVRDKVKKMNLMKGEVQLQATEYDAADDIYEYDLDRMAPAMKDSLVESAGMALGRKYDVVLFTKMWNRDFNSLSQVQGAFTTAWSADLMMAARRQLFNMDVPFDTGDNFCGLPPVVFDTMLKYNVFANSQWVGPDLPFAMNGLRRRSWQNIHFFELPPYLQNEAGTQGKFYLWNKAALGTGDTGEPLRTGWEWVLSEKRWYYQSTLSAGATIIENTSIGHPPAIIECRYKTDILPTYT